jgi:hypothetical protein
VVRFITDEVKRIQREGGVMVARCHRRIVPEGWLDRGATVRPVAAHERDNALGQLKS